MVLFSLFFIGWLFQGPGCVRCHLSGIRIEMQRIRFVKGSFIGEELRSGGLTSVLQAFTNAQVFFEFDSELVLGL